MMIIIQQWLPFIECYMTGSGTLNSISVQFSGFFFLLMTLNKYLNSLLPTPCLQFSFVKWE